MASFTIEGLDSLDKTIKGLGKMKDELPKIIVKVLSTIRNDILKRTTSGQGVNGGKFKPYSKMYKVIRANNHRQTSPVSLTYTGNMLRSMKVFNVSGGGEIKFDSTRANDLAVKHNEEKGVPNREFFGLNKANLAYAEHKITAGVRL
jgi:hypothetical protein